jgi:hypothetical protein
MLVLLLLQVLHPVTLQRLHVLLINIYDTIHLLHILVDIQVWQLFILHNIHCECVYEYNGWHWQICDIFVNVFAHMHCMLLLLLILLILL